MSYFLPRWTRKLVVAATVVGTPVWASAADEPAGPKPEHAVLFKKLDADGDGQLTKDEVPEEQRRLLERLIENNDKNNDGKLSAAEFSAGLGEERPRGDVPPPSGSGGPGRPGGGQFNAEEIFKRIDRNGDGKVTPDEMPEERREGFKQMLSRVDKDKDGAASLDEFRTGFMGAGGPPPGQPQPGQPRPGSSPQPGMPQPGGDGLVRAIDTDKNGELSADEIAAAADSLKKLDRNGDGKVTREEIGPPMPAGGRPGQPGGGQPDPERFLGYMKQMDKDGDGKLSKDEVGERMRENFANLDKNGDGKLDDVELRQMMTNMPRPGNPETRRLEGERKPAGDPKPEGDRKPEARPGADRRPEAPRDGDERFKAADKDGDGLLSKEELPERMREHMAKIDTNGDGKASPEEMREAFRRVMEGRNRPEGDRRPDGARKSTGEQSTSKESDAPKKE